MNASDNLPEQADDSRSDLRFLELHPEPWPEDNRRIRVHVEVTPFDERPDIDLTILNASNEELATVTIVEMLDPKFVITMHLRGEADAGPFTLVGRLYYTEQPTLDEVRCPFDLPPFESNPA